MIEPFSAGMIVVIGVACLVVCGLLIYFLRPTFAAISVGIFLAAFACLIVLIAMPRSGQLAMFGVALGISADGGYAALTNQAPVTMANALVRLAQSIGTAVGIIAEGAGAAIAAKVLSPGVWAFLITSVFIMAASFLYEHSG